VTNFDVFFAVLPTHVYKYIKPYLNSIFQTSEGVDYVRDSCKTKVIELGISLWSSLS